MSGPESEPYAEPSRHHEPLHQDPSMSLALDELYLREREFGAQARSHFSRLLTVDRPQWLDAISGRLAQEVAVLEEALVQTSRKFGDRGRTDVTQINPQMGLLRKAPTLERAMTLSLLGRHDGISELPASSLIALMRTHPCDLVNAAVRKAFVKRAHFDEEPPTLGELLSQADLEHSKTVDPQPTAQRDRKAFADISEITVGTPAAAGLTIKLFAHYQALHYPGGL